MKQLCVAVCFIIVSHSIAFAEEAVVPGAAGWTLRYDRGDSACFVYAVYTESDTVIGFMSDGDSVFFLFADEDWNIPENEGYEVHFRFDGQRWQCGTFSSLSPTAVGMRLYPVGERELHRSLDMEIYSERGNLVGHYSLQGSSQAISYVKKCGVIASGAGDNSFGQPRVDRSGASTTNPFR